MVQSNIKERLNMRTCSTSSNSMEPSPRRRRQARKQMRPRKTEKQRAFTLIEMIGVLAVVAILALALATVTIKYLDRIAAEKETAQLQAFGEAFRQGVIKSKVIPSQTLWDQMIATNLGLQISQIRTNDRRVARVFLIDPNLRVGTGQATTSPLANGKNILPY